MSVTVVSCLYGDRYRAFVPGWAKAVGKLTTRPDHVIVAGDNAAGLPAFARHLIQPCPWLHPQAFYLQQAIEAAVTEWVYIADIDDRPFPDALDGLHDVDADVWLCGYTNDHELYIPSALDNADYLAQTGNPYPAGSAIRTEAFHSAGGFQDVAFQDWALWRRLAACGATFEASGRAHYRYRRHDGTRSAVELTPERRARHLAEMLSTEGEAWARRYVKEGGLCAKS